MALPGARSRKTLIRKNGKKVLLPSKCDRIPVLEGELLYFDTWGGGGWGDPFKRPTEQVAFDVEAGLVSREGAKRYGVVIKANGSVLTRRRRWHCAPRWPRSAARPSCSTSVARLRN